ncbi:hypothetical protein [Geothrix terrae]|uniref:hypothetical protein n=1 Tax=Geothrix terrae TaxID=2922720 RepID=UPI001FAD7746|nr:hypothetical protein [Geothrix terrae]
MRSTSLLPLISVAFLATAAPAFTAEDKTADPGAQVFQGSCLTCHKGNQSLDQVRLTRDKWKEAVDRMADSGFLDPVPSKEKVNLLLDYLAKEKGPVDPGNASKK